MRGARDRELSAVALDVPLVGLQGTGVDLPGSNSRRSPEANIGPWSYVTFRWLNAIIAEGYRRENLRARQTLDPSEAAADTPQSLTEADLFELRAEDLPESLNRRAVAAWAAESESAAATASPASLRRALRMAFGRTFIIAGIFKFFYDTLQMVGPYILKTLLHYLDECKKGDGNVPEDCSVATGLELVGVLCVSNLVQTAILHQYFHRSFRTGMRLNAATICLVYGKSLRIGSSGRPTVENGVGSGASGGAAAAGQTQQLRTSGEIVNLMSVDAQRLQDTMTYLHTLWSGPYQIIITLIFLTYVVSWATLAGVGVMLLQIPLVTFMARRIKLAQRALMKIKDERIKVTNETFGSIRLLKMYGWEASFEARLDAIRERELRQLRKYQVLNIISNALYSTAPILTGVATFGVYTAIYGELSAGTAFAALSLFNVLRFPLTMFPNMVSTAVEAGVAISRVQGFLEAPEVRGRAARPTLHFSVAAAGQSANALPAVRLSKAWLCWPDGTPLLEDATFEVPAPSPDRLGKQAHLTVVLGSVGTGKSGLLQALIGDLQPTDGSVTVEGRIAYTAQVAWIRNASVRDNIIFNSPVDEERYARVLKECCLLPDLEVLPSGDATEIGEKGVNLSGGQKQRVSLARAIYAAPDLLLLDDPLSAVDPNVAQKLLAMLRGFLVAGSSIVLCTHHLAAVQHADQVLLLERDGEESNYEKENTSVRIQGGGSVASRVAFCGTVDEFRRQKPDLAQHEQEGFMRQVSAESFKEGSAVDEKKAGAGKLVEKEAEQVGSVSAGVYWSYVQAAGGCCLASSVIGGVLLGQALQTGADSWVSVWSDHSGDKQGQSFKVSSTLGLIGYASLSLTAFAGIFATSALFRLTALNAARSFHQQLLTNMLKLPMSFYDTTPLGRVLNRFSKDVYTIDEQLQSTLYMYLTTLCRVLATLTVISIATPIFLVFLVPLLWLYRLTQNFYVPASRQLKRIESTLRSPIFSHFAETLDGVASIRAYGQQNRFAAESIHKLQRTMRAYYINVASNRWLAVRLETFGAAIVTAAGLLAVLARDSLSAGFAGLSISYALAVTQSLNWVVRMTSDRETNIVSVERVREYINQPQEPERNLPSDPPQGQWPERGAIEFKDLRLRYRANLPLVLDGFSLSVRPQEKLGICGRTGAGKSSVLNVLLRIVNLEGGCTLIDGIDISTLGLHRLRRSITIIPQDPVLFSGTVKFNLDPLEECTDDALWKALRCAHLSAHVEAITDSQNSNGVGEDRGLESTVAEKGDNFSAGQRQQMCLARALLRANRILLLDEATSSVDVETDALIQQTIHSEFANHTVLCIAHRISTIMGSDRVCVVDAGRVEEVGEPEVLKKTDGSRFRKLATGDDN